MILTVFCTRNVAPFVLLDYSIKLVIVRRKYTFYNYYSACEERIGKTNNIMVKPALSRA